MDYDLTKHKQANLIYQESLENLTPDKVMKFITHHFNYQRPRLETLDDYYQGYNRKILDKQSRRHEDGKADHRATHSFAKYIADFQTSYSVGNPINVKLPEDGNNSGFDTFNKANDVDAENYDLFLDMSRYGRAYEYVYRGEDNEEHLAKLDPLDTFVIYSTDVDPKPIMAVRYHQIELVDDNQVSTINYVPETWTADMYTLYKPTPIMGKMTVDKAKPITTFPVVEFDNSNFRLGDFENVLPLIDLYDAAQSDTANYMTDLNEAMLIIQGDIDTLFEGSDVMNTVDPNDEDAMVKLAKDKLELIKEMKDSNMLLLKSGMTVNGTQTTVDAKYINKSYDVTGSEAYKKRVAGDIHKFSHTPDLTDDNFASNSSGVAMQYKVLGTVELASTKRRMFERGLYARYQIISDIENSIHGDWTFDPQELTFTFRDNLPADSISQIQALVQAGATLPQKYLYQQLPGVTNPQDIVDMMKEQSASGDYSVDQNGVINNDGQTNTTATQTDEEVRGQQGQSVSE